MIPIECFLHRVFPSEIYQNDADRVVRERVFKPRKDCEATYLPLDIDWEANDRQVDRNWRMQLQGWTMFHPVMNFFDDYKDKGAVLDYFFSVAESWSASYIDDPDDVTTSRMPASYAWYDMAVGFRALVIAFFKDRVDGFGLSLSNERKDLLERLATKHIANLSSPITFSLNNHGIFQAHGLMALLVLYPGARSRERRAYAADLMNRLVESQFDESGIHLEHSPHYHFYVLDGFDGVIRSGWYEEFGRVVDRISNAKSVSKWLVDPMKRPICVGDSTLTVSSKVQFPKKTGGADVIHSKFARSGYAVVRSNWSAAPAEASMLFLMGAYHRQTHKHRDCLSFDWFDNGRRVICDSGKYGYVSNKYRHYFLSSRAHNSVEIDGFDVLKMKPYGSALQDVREEEAGVFRLEGELSFPAINHRRTIFFSPGRWVVVVDDLSYVKNRRSTQWFHAETDFELTFSEGKSVVLTGAENRKLFIDCLNSEAELVVQRGDEDAMQGFVSIKDLQFSPGVAIGYRVQGKTHSIKTVLSLSRDAQAEAHGFIGDAVAAGNAEPPAVERPAQCRANKNLIPNVPHWIVTDRRRIQLLDGRNTYRVKSHGVTFNLFCHRKDKRKLLVLLPGASSRAKGHIDFQRQAWSDEFRDHDVVAISDPTLKAENDIKLGWFQNHKDAYGIDALADLIASLAKNLGCGPEDVTIFGSSGGGFAALQLSNLFEKATIIAMNPQIFLARYTRSFFEEMLRTCYPEMSPKEVDRQFGDRISVQLSPNERSGRTFIFQNVHDKLHMDYHLSPFLKNLEEKDVAVHRGPSPTEADQKALNVIYFEDEASGHSPPSKEMTLEMISPYLSRPGS